MTSISQQQPFLSLIQRFLGGELAAAKFCALFTAAWAQDRDQASAKKAAWPQPYDELLMASWRRRELSDSEFQSEWGALWGGAEDAGFRTLVNKIHSACSVFSPFPEMQWELGEEQLKHAVANCLADYELLSKPAVQAA